MTEILFNLNLTAEEYLKYYQGAAQAVVTRSVDGRVLRFPANVIRKFLTHSGIQGKFVIVYNKQNKFEAIKRVS